VPDLRGIFLRGLGSQASTHYGIVTHQSGALGQIQGDAIRNVTGNFGLHDFFGSWQVFQWNSSGAFASSPSVPGYGVQTNNQLRSGLALLNFNSASVVPTAAENRPVNVAVRYLIRASQ